MRNTPNTADVDWQSAPTDLRRVALALAGPQRAAVLRAWQVADAAHAGMMRDEGTPFITHPVEVCRILWDEFACRDADLLCAALLHDVLEDTTVGEDELRATFGEHVTALVVAVTKVQVPTEERSTRDAAYVRSLLVASADVRLLKMADRIHNLRMVPLSGDRAKAQRYLDVSRDVFARMAAATDPRALALLTAACDALELSIKRGTWR